MKTMTTYENKEKKAYIRPSLEAVWIDADALLDDPVRTSLNGTGGNQSPGGGSGWGAKSVGRSRLTSREMAELDASFELEEEIEEETMAGSIEDFDW